MLGLMRRALQRLAPPPPPPPPAPLPMAPDPPGPTYSILGKGGYGFVLKPAIPNNVGGVTVEYPDNVTKIFFSPTEYASTLRAIDAVPRVMGPNNGHRVNRYKKTLRGRNLPRALRQQFRIANDSVLPALRMPDLGKDLSHIDKIKHLVRDVPIPTIIEQIVKLLKQVDSLNRNEFIHGDIRDRNIMINPTTGQLTIIDFDLLKDANSFYHSYAGAFGFYNNPPESLMFAELVRQKHSFLSFYPNYLTVDSLMISQRTFDWLAVNIDAYGEYLNAIGLNRVDLLKNAITNANISNLEYLQSSHDFEFVYKSKVLPKLDSYALGIALCDMLCSVYTSSVIGYRDGRPIDATAIESLKSTIKSVVTNRGTPYDDDALTACCKALLQICGILRLSCSFLNKNRISPEDALRKARIINARLHAELGAVRPATAAATPAPAAPVPAAPAPAGSATTAADVENSLNGFESARSVGGRRHRRRTSKNKCRFSRALRPVKN